MLSGVSEQHVSDEEHKRYGGKRHRAGRKLVNRGDGDTVRAFVPLDIRKVQQMVVCGALLVIGSKNFVGPKRASEFQPGLRIPRFDVGVIC